jgi:hypothetical protein
VDGHGLVRLDAFVDKQLNRILREKFSVDLTGLPYSDTLRLDRILGFHLASTGNLEFLLRDGYRGRLFAFRNQLRYRLLEAGNSECVAQADKPLCLLTRDDLVDELSLFFSPGDN